MEKTKRKFGMEIRNLQCITGELYHFNYLLDDGDCLKISLRRGDDNLIISFDEHLSYRKGDEGDMLRTLEEIEMHDRLGCTLYEATLTNYINWFVDQCCGSKNHEELKEYIIVTNNDIIEVISLNAPSVEIG